MRSFKFLSAFLIVMIACGGKSNIAMAASRNRTCIYCNKNKSINEFPGGGNICNRCLKDRNKDNDKKTPQTKKQPKTCAQCGATITGKGTMCETCRTRKQQEEREKEIIDNYVNNMVFVEGGTFSMGGKSLWVSSFSIGKTEVTQELWCAVMGSNPSRFSGNKLPVENVSWEDCHRFITELNKRTGRNFRLPKEAEWEFAARGGNKSLGFMYSGAGSVADVAWFQENSGHSTHEVAEKLTNELGLSDMSGNVWEWCDDHWYSYDDRSATSDEYVCRGGSWRNPKELNSVSYRISFPGYTSREDIGFRLACW